MEMSRSGLFLVSVFAVCVGARIFSIVLRAAPQPGNVWRIDHTRICRADPPWHRQSRPELGAAQGWSLFFGQASSSRVGLKSRKLLASLLESPLALASDSHAVIHGAAYTKPNDPSICRSLGFLLSEQIWRVFCVPGGDSGTRGLYQCGGAVLPGWAIRVFEDFRLGAPKRRVSVRGPPKLRVVVWVSF